MVTLGNAFSSDQLCLFGYRCTTTCALICETIKKVWKTNAPKNHGTDFSPELVVAGTALLKACCLQQATDKWPESTAKQDAIVSQDETLEAANAK